MKPLVRRGLLSILLLLSSSLFVVLLPSVAGAAGGDCASGPPLQSQPALGLVFNHTSFSGSLDSRYTACGDFGSGVTYSVVNGEQKIRIGSAASGTGDASMVRWYRAALGQVYSATALARMENMTQQTPGDFRVRLKLSSHSSNGVQEYECGTLANSGNVGGVGTGVPPFVDLLEETPASVPMHVECAIEDISEQDHQVHISFRARRQPNDLLGTSGSATGTAVLTSLLFAREA